jgi:hypothetical protein
MTNRFFSMHRNSDEEIISYIERCQGFPTTDIAASIENFVFEEFYLEDLKLPSVDSMLSSVLDLENQIGLQGWKTQDKESDVYKGFSITHNPHFHDESQSVFHQTWGSDLLTQYLSKKINQGNHSAVRDTYYDSYAFRQIHPLIYDKLSPLLGKFVPAIVRSRVAYSYGFAQGYKKYDNWHIDEFPYQVLRCIIPLQTSHEHVIDIVGSDEFGNNVNIVDRHLECGKIYFWNSRIPHRVTLKQLCITKFPRIHIILGLAPWFSYDKDSDSFYKNNLWGLPINQIVRDKLFLI